MHCYLMYSSQSGLYQYRYRSHVTMPVELHRISFLFSKYNEVRVGVRQRHSLTKALRDKERFPLNY